jgi:hypothetical protein
MRAMKRVLVTLVFVGLSVSAFYAVKAKYPNYMGNASEKTFQELQGELNKEKYKRKVVSRFEVIEGLRGLNIEDISLTLLDYSYHILNDSGRRQPFVTVQCRIDISKFEKDAEKLREHLKSTGRRAPVNIELPDSERTILGLIDDVKDEFITLVSLPKWVTPVVQFADLRKNRPEYMILTLEPAENCTECDLVKAFSTAVFGFDEKNKTYDKILDLKIYREVESHDDLNTGYGYIDKSSVSWSDWINNEYRELIISTERKTLGPEGVAKEEFKNKKEIYSWVNDKELALVERIVDGKSTISRRKSPLSAVEVTLKDGELYEMIGKPGASKITSTNGKINSYLLSPDKRYVAYSIVVGYTNDAGIYEEGEKIPQVPVYHIVVMDIDLKKVLTEIKPPSEHEPFIYVDRWISNDELLFYDADGIAVGWKYIFNAGTNELRRADLQEMNL